MNHPIKITSNQEIKIRVLPDENTIKHLIESFKKDGIDLDCSDCTAYRYLK